jgi:hypothetical protein
MINELIPEDNDLTLSEKKRLPEITVPGSWQHY